MHYNFYIYICYKNNKFGLLLWSLFGIINLQDRKVESQESKVESKNRGNPNFRTMIEDIRPLTLDIRHKK
jgi:hypothetical protein